MQNLFDPGGKRRQLNQSLKQELYTVSEAAEAMRKSTSTVHRLIREGKLSCVQEGERGKRIPKQAIIDYFAPSPIEKFLR
jgi:excisionase family DNA binding protein